MPELKTTAPPWRVEPDTPTSIIIKSSHYTIARVFGGIAPHTRTETGENATMRANGQAIAKTPEMLEVLRDMVEADRANHEIPVELMARARNVLINATAHTDDAPRRREHPDDPLPEPTVASDLLDALQAICAMPWGWCCCPPGMGSMELKPDEAHCGECRHARAAIARAEEQGMTSETKPTDGPWYVDGDPDRCRRLPGRRRWFVHWG